MNPFSFFLKVRKAHSKFSSCFKAFTLMEVICSLSLLMLVLILLLNISAHTLLRVSTYNQEISNNQTLDNLRDFIHQEFKQNNLSILEVNTNNSLIQYQVFKKDPRGPTG